MQKRGLTGSVRGYEWMPSSTVKGRAMVPVTVPVMCPRWTGA